MQQHLHHGGARRRKDRAKIENLCKKIMMENFPNPVKEIDILSPESSESPKQDEPKQAYTKTHHN